MSKEDLLTEAHHKIGVATAAVVRLAVEKQRHAACGETCIRLGWEAGRLMIVEIQDTTNSPGAACAGAARETV